MSKLNPGAFSFVPGRGFVANDPPPQPPLAPFERQEQIEAPRPAPTISLNIGGSSTPPAPRPAPAAVPSPVPVAAAPVATAPPPVKAAPSPAVKIVKNDSASAPSKTFSTEKAKTDTSAIAAEVKALADQTTLEDLFGNGQPATDLASDLANFFMQSRSTSTSSSSAMSMPANPPWAAISFS